ncbi:hypothetical protein [Blastococcus brunescens]|uniref:DUF4386 family protein n=1 Tax=Blastococcus brunescens TaxID=1564165 RepID=A0ABZ1B6N9_9ACTN|nr:hypothetical protein [Blastococcus sp. BMG 8361]WRL65059.1 hypothetical protein U6N30_05000 [Blastococcus sp. BMG 8361]
MDPAPSGDGAGSRTLAGLATTLVWPQTPLDVAERLEVLAGTTARTHLAHLLNLVTILLFVPAVAGMHRLLQPHRARAAAIGTGLVAAGLVGWSGVLALGAAELQLAGTLSGGTAVSAVESLPSSPVAIAMTAGFLLGTFSGLVVLTVGLWRAQVVPAWVSAAVGLAVVGDVVGSTITAVVIAVWVLFAVALTAVARARATAPEQRLTAQPSGAGGGHITPGGVGGRVAPPTS